MRARPAFLHPQTILGYCKDLEFSVLRIATPKALCCGTRMPLAAKLSSNDRRSQYAAA